MGAGQEGPIAETPKIGAKTKRKMAISMRNAQLQREPAGRFRAGGIGVVSAFERMSSGTGASGLGERQLAGGGVVIENFRVAAPLDGGFELAAGFFLAEMLVEQIPEEFIVERAVGFGLERLFHLAEQWNVGERGFSKNRFSCLNVRLRQRLPLPSDNRIAFFNA